MMAYVINFATYTVPFLVVLGVLVFFHELGHFLAARWAGVRVLSFSIGFGPELVGWNDRLGTRWKICVLPLGGYVMMFGDADPASQPDQEAVAAMSEAERAQTHGSKSIFERAVISAAGPLANFILALIVFTALFLTAGVPYESSEITAVSPGSSAEEAGLKAGDKIISIDGYTINKFRDIVVHVNLNVGAPMLLKVQREEQSLSFSITPKRKDIVDNFGNHHESVLLGVQSDKAAYLPVGVFGAVSAAAQHIGQSVSSTMIGLGQMIIGARGSSDLGGPLRIAKMSGEAAQLGWQNVVVLIGEVSIGLGLINLFPIPVLDGGHLLLYSAEAVRGRPLGPRAQEWFFGTGLLLVLSMMVFATWNDLKQLGVVHFIIGLVTSGS